MFYCCRANPKACVYNNKSLLNDANGAKDRIATKIKNKLSHDEVPRLIKDVKESSMKNKPLQLCI